MIKDPVILLEKCDKIWETLQLIKTVQIEKPTVPIDDCDKNEEKKKEEKEQNSNQIKQSVSYVKNQLRSRSDNAVSLPFKFSVQKTRRLYPCTICGKQYLERRSLRKHSERVHGIVLPLLIRKRMKRTIKKKNFDEASPVISISKENTSSEKLDNNKDSCEKITAKPKLTSIVTTASQPAAVVNSLRQFVKCTLCQQKVTSLRKHLINYHKIGSSSSMVEQLESSLLSKTETSPGDKKTTLTNESHQDGLRIMDNENDTHGTSRVKRKAKYTSYYANVRKKLKLNAFVKNPPAMQKQSLNVNSYKCNICLGMYSSTHSLYKHKRIHKLRGETRENFHNFKCRYFNSPFNKKYKLQSSVTSVNTIAKNTSNEVNENVALQLNNSKRNTLVNQKSQTSKIDRATRYNERMNRSKETICICGRSFRNPHTLFIHKKNCELCPNEDDTIQNTRASSDRDSGIGINITIKKRNDSYEIVGKDDEDKSQNSETLQNSFRENSSMSHVSNSTKDFPKTSIKQQVVDAFESSKYSKNHSILKLQDIDEDVLIDIEDEVQFDFNEDNTTKQIITQEDSKQDSSKQQNDNTKDGKTEKVFDKVTTLKQMCQEVLDVLEKRKSKNVTNKNKDKEYSQIKDQKTCKENNQIKNQEIYQENKRRLRSTNKRYQYSEVELDHSYDGTKVCIMQFDPLICGYCKEQFSTVKLYDNHQCTVIEGKSFNEFSLELSCFYCKEILNSYNEFDDHVRMKHFDNSYHCYQCTERFTNDKARLNHFHSEHNDLICRVCSKKISISVKALHEGYHLGFGYPCHKCKKAYTNSKNLSYHRYTIHANGVDNLITCTICLKLIKLKTFRGHMATHKHNACHFCGKVFSDRVGLEYHTMLHHGTNSKLKCNICGTRFNTKKQLERHEKMDRCNNGMQKKRKL